MAPKPDEEDPPAETLKYQTWVLKVLIHCEACKKKVKKVLQGIEGVYTTEIDSQQHKVTVTGNVDAETLIKKLQRSRKIVELWPEKKDKKSGNSKGDDNKNGEHKDPAVNDAKNGDTNDPAGGGESDKEDSECDEAGGVSGGGGAGGEEGGKKKKKKKKKKKQGQNGGSPNNGGGEKSVVDAAPATGSPVTGQGPNLGTLMAPVDFSPPIQHAYPYPRQMYYPPPAPAGPRVYGMSYNTAYPSASTSYYAAHPMHAYATYYSLPSSPPPCDPIKHYIDDDEGGCSIM